MPLIVEPIKVADVKEHVQVKVEPVVQNAMNTEIDDATAAYILLGMFVIYLFRSLFFPILVFAFKFGIAALFSFLTYVMFFT
jgi:hypothetical protein